MAEEGEGHPGEKHIDPELLRRIKEAEKRESIDLTRDVLPGDTIHFGTKSGSRYEFEVGEVAGKDEKGRRRAASGTLKGGSLMRLYGVEEIEGVKINGSTFGGSMLKIDTLVKGMYPEAILPEDYRHKGTYLRITPIKYVYIVRPHPSGLE